MALYHNLSCSKSNLGRRAENSFLWALSHPSLLFLHTLLSHPFKHLCSGCTKKRRAKNCSCRWRLPYATLGALPVSPGAGTARLPPRHGDGSSHCRASTVSGALSSCTLQPDCRDSPADSGCSSHGTAAALLWAALQGWLFSPRKTLTCNYAAVQITAKAGIRQHRKAVTVYFSTSKQTKKYLNTFSSK